jgi:hypothetical protein
MKSRLEQVFKYKILFILQSTQIFKDTANLSN